MKWWFKNLVTKCHRILVWIPVLWRDVDWDYSSIYTILQFKLSMLRKRLHKDAFTKGYEKSCKQIRVAELLLGRLKAEDYIPDAFAEHFEKYPMRDKNGTLINFDSNPARRKEFGILMDREQYLQKQDEEYLFKHLCKHMKKWWN